MPVVPDPLDTLSRLADGQARPMLPPAEVRRRGDRLRRRRTGLRTLGGALAVAVVLGGVALTTGTDGGTSREPAPATQSSSPTGAATAMAVPAWFPLDQGYPDPGGDGSVTGPSSSRAAALAPIEACGQRAYPVVRPAGRQSVRLQQPEDFRARELTTYDDEAAAKQALASFASALRDCPRETTDGTTATNTVSTVRAGDQSWGVVTTYETDGRPSLGLQVTTATRAGAALLVATQANEGDAGSAQAQLDQQVEEVRALLPLLSVGPDSPGTGVLTHDGYRSLRLGMSREEASATGDLAITGSGDGACAGFTLTDHPARKNQVDGFVSKQHGLVAVFARPDMATEEGVRLGDTRQQVRGAYGGPVTTEPFLTVPLSEGTSYVFGFDHDRLVSVVVQRDRQDCYQ